MNDFIHKVVREGLFDKKVSELLLNSNLEQRVLEFLMYGSSIDDRTYSELRQTPVNTLTKQFVERWLVDNYLTSPAAQATMKRIATHIWESECGTN